MAAKVETEDGENAVAGFITKVWSIVNMKEYDHLISWTEVHMLIAFWLSAWSTRV